MFANLKTKDRQEPKSMEELGKIIDEVVPHYFMERFKKELSPQQASNDEHFDDLYDELYFTVETELLDMINDALSQCQEEVYALDRSDFQ